METGAVWSETKLRRVILALFERILLEYTLAVAKM